MSFIVNSSFELTGKSNVFEVGLEKDNDYEYTLSVSDGEGEVKVEALNYESDTWEPIISDGSFSVPAVKMHLESDPPRFRMKFIINKKGGGTDAEYTFTLNKI